MCGYSAAISCLKIYRLRVKPSLCDAMSGVSSSTDCPAACLGAIAGVVTSDVQVVAAEPEAQTEGALQSGYTLSDAGITLSETLGRLQVLHNASTGERVALDAPPPESNYRCLMGVFT